MLSYEELVDEMIADAWYMVSEYHLNLGPRDNLERLVNYMHETTQMKPSESKPVILQFLKESKDKEILGYKKKLIDNVPYRLQAPLMPEVKSVQLDGNINLRIQRINQQKRNPNVPGIADKLYPPQERNLKRVIQYWKTIVTLEPVKEIYDNQIITPDAISIDHFVPWSYVAHDEFWNLHPTTRSINSSKSNHLAEWETYFKSFAGLQYDSYRMMWRYDTVRNEFEKCAKEHLNNEEIECCLY